MLEELYEMLNVIKLVKMVVLLIMLLRSIITKKMQMASAELILFHLSLGTILLICCITIQPKGNKLPSLVRCKVANTQTAIIMKIGRASYREREKISEIRLSYRRRI